MKIINTKGVYKMAGNLNLVEKIRSLDNALTALEDVINTVKRIGPQYPQNNTSDGKQISKDEIVNNLSQAYSLITSANQDIKYYAEFIDKQMFQR